MKHDYFIFNVFPGGDAEVLIPSVFIGRSDAEKIIKQFSFPNLDFVLKLTENAPFDINTYLLPFAIVVGICFIIMLGIMVFKCIQDRRRERRHRLPKSSLKKIPTKVVKKFFYGGLFKKRNREYKSSEYILRNFKLETRFGMKPAASVWMIMFWGIN